MKVEPPRLAKVGLVVLGANLLGELGKNVAKSRGVRRRWQCLVRCVEEFVNSREVEVSAWGVGVG